MKIWKILNLSQGWTKDNQMQREGRIRRQNPKDKKPNQKGKWTKKYSKP